MDVHKTVGPVHYLHINIYTRFFQNFNFWKNHASDAY